MSSLQVMIAISYCHMISCQCQARRYDSDIPLQCSIAGVGKCVTMFYYYLYRAGLFLTNLENGLRLCETPLDFGWGIVPSRRRRWRLQPALSATCQHTALPDVVLRRNRGVRPNPAILFQRETICNSS